MSFVPAATPSFLRFETKVPVRAGSTFTLQARPKALFRCEYIEAVEYEGISVESFGAAAPDMKIQRALYCYMPHPLFSGWMFSGVAANQLICLTLHSDRELPNGFSCRMVGRAVIPLVDVTI